MKIEEITLRLSFFMFLIAAGLLMVALSFVLLKGDILQAKGFRAIGFFCLLLGLGEYLNHPLQKKQTLTARQGSGPPTPALHRSRNPCGLGNTFDVLAVICLFLALSYFFFPYQR